MIGQAENYRKYRGKCKEMSEALAAKDPSLRVVRGHYDCPIWGRQAHWWCVDQNGKIVDPTAKQFPSAGIGEYVEFSGYFECEQCGKSVPENEVVPVGGHPTCSNECAMRLVGL